MDHRRRHPLIALLVFVLAGAPALAGGLLDEFDRLTGGNALGSAREFLPAEQAFVLRESLRADGSLGIDIAIEPGYYLYRDKLAVNALTPGLALGAPVLPAGEIKNDPEFGAVPILRDALALDVPVRERPAGAALLEVEVRYQGCAEDGICYPPIKRTVGFPAVTSATAPALATTAPAPAGAAPLAAADRIARDLAERSLGLTVLSFLGLGLLLALTPCVLPMVPILSGIIVGQRAPVSGWRAFALSTTYVLAMAAAYAVAGIAAGLAGRNLQAAFQHPAVIAAFAALFVVLALAMFGLFELALPAVLQSRLDRLSRAQRGGSYGGVAVMGVLSAVIVGPCVAPPLAGALAYIGQTGSALVGGTALFALGLGMGLPLIALGTSAGALLPRAGPWMVTLRKGFGVVFLAVAIGFLSRVLPGPLTLLLWAFLLIGTAMFLGALERPPADAGAWSRLRQGAGLICLLYGGILVVGAAAGADDPIKPLVPLTRGGAGSAPPPASFIAVDDTAALDTALAAASAAGQVAVLDFYADWCVECKPLERETFTDSVIAPRLARMRLLRADVTADDADDRALLARFGLYGPPAVLFFSGGAEQRANRLIGFADAAAFAGHLDRAEAAAR